MTAHGDRPAPEGGPNHIDEPTGSGTKRKLKTAIHTNQNARKRACLIQTETYPEIGFEVDLE
jgi:hypothetical protein